MATRAWREAYARALTTRVQNLRAATDIPWRRKPVLIAGTTVEGLVLAQLLKYGGVPYEIYPCGTTGTRLSDRLASFHSLNESVWKPLEPVLGHEWVKSLAFESAFRSRPLSSSARCQVKRIQLENFLREGLEIHCDHQLTTLGITPQTSADPKSSDPRQVIADASFIVGADGRNSAVRSLHAITERCDTDDVKETLRNRLYALDWYCYPFIKARSCWRISASEYESSFAPYLDKSGGSSEYQSDQTILYLRSRMQKTELAGSDIDIELFVEKPCEAIQDFQNFYRFPPHRKVATVWQQGVHEGLLQLYNAMGTLPAPFAAIRTLFGRQGQYKCFPLYSMQLDLKKPPDKIHISANPKPMVLIGHAAHKLPLDYNLPKYEMMEGILDGIEAGLLIAESKSNYRPLSNVPESYYREASSRWSSEFLAWERRIAQRFNINKRAEAGWIKVESLETLNSHLAKEVPVQQLRQAQNRRRTANANYRARLQKARSSGSCLGWLQKQLLSEKHGTRTSHPLSTSLSRQKRDFSLAIRPASAGSNVQ